MKELPEQGIKFTALGRIHTKGETFLNVIFYSSFYNSDLCIVTPPLLSSADLQLMSDQAQGSPFLSVTMPESCGQ